MKKERQKVQVKKMLIINDAVTKTPLTKYLSKNSIDMFKV